jgi:A/G-specific adenine glycosylase
MDRFPTIQVLAEASSEQVNTVWAGLGYYRRAAQIHACAKKLVAEHKSQLPETTEELMKLPGIGR